MSFTPPPHPNTRPRQGAAEPRDAGARAFVAGWYAQVEAQRQARLALADPEAERLRAIVLANERLICTRGR